MTGVKIIKRLSWDSRFPAPFESGWSIFSKITILNHISIAQLISIIKKDSAEISAQKPIDISKSDWIDFDKFSDLLGVSQKRLKEGFWDQLGFSTTGRSSYAISICHQCWASGYHCAFFDLLGIETCPWHACKLATPCKYCCMPSTFSWRSNETGIQGRYCSKCKLALPKIAELLAVDPFYLESQFKIRETCEKIVQWWDSIRDCVPARDTLLKDILFFLPEDRAIRTEHRPDQISFAKSISPVNLAPWELHCEDTKFLYRYFIQEQLFQNEREENINSDSGRAYKSIRRHIHKKVLKNHRTCIAGYLKLDRYECKALCGSDICLPALAFVIWRMSIEGTSNIEALHNKEVLRDNLVSSSHRSSRRSLRLIEPYLPFNISNSIRLSLTFLGFFSILNEIIKKCKTKNVQIILGDGLYNSLFHCEIDRSSESSETHTLHVLIPNNLDMCEKLSENCTKNSTSKSVVDYWFVDRDIRWSRGVDTGNPRRCLFKIRNECAKHANKQFIYIMV